MAERDACGSSSPSSGSSGSEGEYMVDEEEGVGVPKFDFSCWNPEAPAGLSFLSLLPVSNGYQLAYPQEEHVGKVKISLIHRRTRQKQFASGASIGRNIVDEKRLRQAADANDYNLVKELLDSGVDACSRDDKKRTPLHFAASKGNQDIVSLLVDYGADPNQQDMIGNTPLHLAACTNHIETVTVLLRAGTNVHMLDNMGNTPLQLARSRLRTLQDSNTVSSDQRKKEVSRIIAMMKEYLSRAGHVDGISQLDDLCDKLEATTTRDELDVISDLLTDFTNLNLKRETQPG